MRPTTLFLSRNVALDEHFPDTIIPVQRYHVAPNVVSAICEEGTHILECRHSDLMLVCESLKGNEEESVGIWVDVDPVADMIDPFLDFYLVPLVPPFDPCLDWRY